MYTKMLRILFFTGMMSCSLSFVSAQVRTEYIPPSFAVGARANALSNSYISEPYDLTNMYLNPAAINFVRRNSISLNHYQDLEQDFMNENVTFSISRSSMGSFAAGISVNHIGYLKHHFPTDFKAIQYGVDVAYATELTSVLSFGTRISSRYGQSGTNELLAFSSAFGIFYFPTPNISYGISLNNLGEGFRYIFLNTNTTIEKENLNRSLQVGLTVRYPSALASPKAVIAIANEKILEKDGLLYKVGVEYYPFEILSLRGGYLVEPDATTAKYGVGLHMNQIQLDWAISGSRLSDRYFQISLSFFMK